jgi:sigma-B regulation protein RsbU (phosphoserine phosphatase)
MLDMRMGSLSPAEIRAMLRADVVSVVLGVVLVSAGIASLIFSALARRRAGSLGWLGLFAWLYGLRLLARADSFRLAFDVPEIVWEFVAAVITYTVPIPILLFIREFVPSWRPFTTTVAIVVSVFAACAIASDFIRFRPFSASTPNNIIAIGLIGVLVALFFRPGLTPSRDLTVARIGVVAVAVAAVADNLRGMKIVWFPGPDVEPFGFTVLAICLGMLAASRMLREGRRLVALDRELALARQIQSSILPQAMPKIAALNLAARYRPMTAVAGDFYDFVAIDDSRLGVLIADVSGHGVPAAMIASMVKVALAAQQAQAHRPSAVLTGMNEALFGRLAGQYVTASYLFIDSRSGVIRYAAAGHPPMFRLIRRNLEVGEIEKNGLALGFFEAASYEEIEHSLEVGDRLLLYTDGMIEAENAAEDFFGAERVKLAIAAAAPLSPDAAADALLETIHTWSGRSANDDLTIVLVDWQPATS